MSQKIIGAAAAILVIFMVGYLMYPTKAPAGTWHMDQCHSDSFSAALQLSQLRADAPHKPECDEVGLCTCEEGYYFNGKECLALKGSNWEQMFATLKNKWHEVPSRKEEYANVDIQIDGVTASTSKLLKLTDKQLLSFWRGAAPSDTFTNFYASTFQNKKVLDIGSGMARQTLQFALNGAHVTYCDVVPTNLEVIRRVASALGCASRVKTILITDLNKFKQDLSQHAKSSPDFMPLDVITAFGSMHHVPSEFIHKEVNILLEHLRIGGTWLQLAYPIHRWTQDGGPPFSEGGWGGDDNGKTKTPWAEWYEPGKLMKILRPHEFHMNWCGIVGGFEFIWFELTHLGMGGDGKASNWWSHPHNKKEL